MTLGKKEPCTGGCGKSGCFWSDPAGRCPDCRKVECKLCKTRFSPTRRNPTKVCHTCRYRRRATLSHVNEEALC